MTMRRFPFASMVFKGQRFGGPQMPVEVLPELAAYRELILTIARDIWLRRNPGRQRVPKLFESGFRLVLTSFREGSTVPVIEREVEAEILPLLDVPPSDEFEEARRHVEQMIRSFGIDGSIPDDFPKVALSRFNAFGRSLQRDEALFLGDPGHEATARYDKDVRKRILLHERTTYEDGTSEVGWVTALDKEENTFQLRMSDYRKIPVRFKPLFLGIAIEALRGEPLVRVDGTGLFNAYDQLLEVIDAEDVTLEESQSPPEESRSAQTPVPQQISILAALKPGWHDGEGLALSPAGLSWFGVLMAEIVSAFDLPTPFLYPTLEGGVRAEWSGPFHELAVEFDLRARLAHSLVIGLDGGTVSEESFDLSVVGRELRLGRLLQDRLRKRGPSSDATEQTH